MTEHTMQHYIKEVLENMPEGWLNITTHRLDIYDEQKAKTGFLDQFESLFNTHNTATKALYALPTAYDYIRLGHPLSCVLEWGIAKLNKLKPENVIAFSSQTAPILAILRKNLLANKHTQICYMGELPKAFDAAIIRKVYGYTFEVVKLGNMEEVTCNSGSIVFISSEDKISSTAMYTNIDFYVTLYANLGSILLVNGSKNESYVSEIQHVRRRETIAMTPVNCLAALKSLTGNTTIVSTDRLARHKTSVIQAINQFTGTNTIPLVGSSGLSTQYAIMMGLIDDAIENHPEKAIKIIVPPNSYGGTNDQARRVAACIPNVEILDLLVDGDNDMVQSIDNILEKVATEDAIPYIIAEIPTNPRVEVPNLIQLKKVLSKVRKTSKDTLAVDPVFILDQTFCPNVHFLGEGEILASVRTIVYASGSKFPSGGLCTAGYCVANEKANALMQKIALHLSLCDNEATALQYELLAKQLPSMNQRIADAYSNTRAFVNYIKETLPSAKINFVSEELAEQGFTPSVFSLDLPTKGNTAEEKEAYKRALNLQLINLMITKIPSESKYCVSYGQLKGCYWTIPATSTQGTTKEGDKDYIIRVALSANMDLDLHKKVFLEFVKRI